MHNYAHILREALSFRMQKFVENIRKEIILWALFK